MENKTPTAEWKAVKEVSKSGKSIAFTAFLVRILPHRMLVATTRFVSVFYWAFTKWARDISRIYQKNLIAFAKNLPEELKKELAAAGVKINVPHLPNTYRHIASFATCLVEKIEGWSGKAGMQDIEFAGAEGTESNSDTDVKEVRAHLRNHQGCMLICSHLGNIELFRSILSFGADDFDHQIPVSIIMDQKVTANFNNLIGSINSNAKLNVIAADDISMGTMEQLEQTIADGGLVVISADRVPAYNTARSLSVNFLGKPAKIPYGPFLINALLKCPTYFIFSMRKHQAGFDPTYTIHIIKSDISFEGGRKEREEKINTLANRYVRLMERFCLKYPYQWYNFFDFWNEGDK